MATRRSGDCRIVLVVGGVAGVVMAHMLDYLLVFRSASARTHELAATGHGLWPDALAVAIGAGALAVGTAMAKGGAGALLRWAARPHDTPCRDLGALALWQVGLFTAVEVIERLAAHQSPLALAHGPLFPAGVGLQVLVAVAVLAALRFLERLGTALVAAVAGAVRRPRRSRRPAFAQALGLGLPGRSPAGPAQPRGPPLLFAA
jgi:hypothetical protein